MKLIPLLWNFSLTHKRLSSYPTQKFKLISQWYQLSYKARSFLFITHCGIHSQHLLSNHVLFFCTRVKGTIDNESDIFLPVSWLAGHKFYTRPYMIWVYTIGFDTILDFTWAHKSIEPVSTRLAWRDASRTFFPYSINWPQVWHFFFLSRA